MQGDLLLLAAGAPAMVHRALDRVRQFLARTLGLIDANRHNLLWITGARKWAPVSWTAIQQGRECALFLTKTVDIICQAFS